MGRFVLSRRLGLGPRMLGFASLVAAILVVEALVRAGLINRFIVPLPSEILARFGVVVVEEDIPARFLLTAGEALAAGVMIVAVGLPLGLLLHRFGLLRQACESWVAALAAAPLVLLYPLFLVLFGRSAMTIVMMGFFSGLPPMILKTLEGLTGVRRVLVDVGRSFNLTRSQLFRTVLFPAAMPTIFVGLRLGMIFSLINIVGLEFLINLGGLGQLINELAERYDLAGMYAAVGFVILVSVCFFVVTERIETWLRPAA